MTTSSGLYYSPTTGWFYSDEEHGSAIPPDSIRISAALHEVLYDGLSHGKSIVIGRDGIPSVIDRPPVTSQQEILTSFTAAVQSHLDAAAQRAGYDSIYTAVSYADEPAVPKFQFEGQAFRAWRSLVWAAANTIRAEVEAGTRPVPTIAQLIAELPLLSLPE